MSDSIGPMLAAGGITFFNEWIGNNQGIDIKILVATGAACAILALIEKASEPLAVGLAWIALVSSLLISPKGGKAPVTNAINLTGLGK